MTMVLRPGESVDDLVGSGPGSCPACGGRLQKWGHGRWRVVRGGELGGFRPGRVRCADCRVTQVLLPADVLVRRRDEVGVVGAAWRSFAAGAGARQVAHRTNVPMETARGWLRRLRLVARGMRASAGPMDPAGGRPPLQWALSFVEAEALVAGWQGEVELWRFVAWSSQGRLLSTPVDPVWWR